MRRSISTVVVFGVLLTLVLGKSGPLFFYNMATARLARDWIHLAQSSFPPCGSSTVRDPHLERVMLPSPQIDVAVRATHGRRLWLEGQCNDAISEWIAAGREGYRPTGLYLFYTARWRDMPDPLRLSASQYAAMMGTTAQSQGLANDAVTWYERSWFLAPTIKAAQWLADRYALEGKTDQVIAVWAETRKALSSDTADYWHAIGKLAGLNRDWKQAAEAYGNAARFSSDPVSFLLSQAEAYEQARLWGEAEAAYTAVVTHDPLAAAAYAALVALASERGDYVAQQKWQQEAAVLFDSPARALSLGYAYLYRHQPELAYPYLKKAYEANPSDFWTTYLWAQVLHDVEEKDEAIKLLQQAIALHPGRPGQWQILLGDWLVEQGYPEEARTAYQTAIEWGEDALKLSTKLERLK